jgi:hypothetical protein
MKVYVMFSSPYIENPSQAQIDFIEDAGYDLKPIGALDNDQFEIVVPGDSLKYACTFEDESKFVHVEDLTDLLEITTTFHRIILHRNGPITTDPRYKNVRNRFVGIPEYAYVIEIYNGYRE